MIRRPRPRALNWTVILVGLAPFFIFGALGVGLFLLVRAVW